MTTATRGRTILRPVTRVVTGTGLVLDGVVHLQWAHGHQLAAPAGIGQRNLFRVEAAVALVVAAWVVVRPSRAAYGAALVVAAGALVAVRHRYVDVPAFGPLPSMCEPLWFAGKTLSAVTEAGAALAAARGLPTGRQP